MAGNLHFAQNILQLALSPARGWEDVGAVGADPVALMHLRLYPLMGIAAASVLLQAFYGQGLAMAAVLVRMLGIFASYFVGLHFALLVFRTFFYKYTEGEPNERKYTTMIVYVNGLLCLSTIICNVMPVDLGFSLLLPLLVTLVMWKSYIYLCVEPSKELTFVVFGIFSVIVPPLALQSLFNIFA